MNFTNINDPAGVQTLLDQLRASKAWQEAVSVTPAALDQQPAPASSSRATSASSSASVADLLSRLQSSPSWRPSDTTAGEHGSEHGSEHNISNSVSPVPIESTLAKPLIPSPRTKAPDPRTLTFQQALPHLAQLADDPQFVAAITQLKKEQDDLERQLWEERRNIHRRYDEKVKVATTKASMIGDSGLSKHEADMLQSGLKKELEKFDRDRVLVAWDGLISRQQTVLAQHNVPTMYPTTESVDRERQQRVMQVLEGILRT
ncbi:putative protein of unknown function (DUF2458) [Lyophyllum shimeji]|uniref:Uncharacterized protein n=1 Tax=Lyophyllum shimeji TaxID=47721 RepID=A0A9P3UJK3_LYOSH|nr:putative protein of unknown function (DUF2458) [Lyophyllum shimeji]